jgi:hypothetical protein
VYQYHTWLLLVAEVAAGQEIITGLSDQVEVEQVVYYLEPLLQVLA